MSKQILPQTRGDRDTWNYVTSFLDTQTLVGLSITNRKWHQQIETNNALPHSQSAILKLTELGITAPKEWLQRFKQKYQLTISAYRLLKFVNKLKRLKQFPFNEENIACVLILFQQNPISLIAWLKINDIANLKKLIAQDAKLEQLLWQMTADPETQKTLATQAKKTLEFAEKYVLFNQLKILGIAQQLKKIQADCASLIERRDRILTQQSMAIISACLVSSVTGTGALPLFCILIMPLIITLPFGGAFPIMVLGVLLAMAIGMVLGWGIGWGIGLPLDRIYDYFFSDERQLQIEIDGLKITIIQLEQELAQTQQELTQANKILQEHTPKAEQITPEPPRDTTPLPLKKLTIRELLTSNLALFKRLENTYLEEHRYDDPRLQHEYDKRFGLVLSKSK